MQGFRKGSVFLSSPLSLGAVSQEEGCGRRYGNQIRESCCHASVRLSIHPSTLIMVLILDFFALNNVLFSRPRPQETHSLLLHPSPLYPFNFFFLRSPFTSDIILGRQTKDRLPPWAGLGHKHTDHVVSEDFKVVKVPPLLVVMWKLKDCFFI